MSNVPPPPMQSHGQWNDGIDSYGPTNASAARSQGLTPPTRRLYFRACPGGRLELVKNKAAIMKRFSRLVVAIAVSIAILISGPAPALASPSDPVTLDALRSSPGYRTDHGDVLRLYRAFFNREPDVEGTLYWMDVYDEGATLDDLAWAFANSTEFINAFGGTLSDRAFLNIVYGNVLARTPDPGGMEYWLGQMASGLSQPGVVRWVVANPEFINSYPYPDTGGDLSAATLKLSDMPTGWTTVPDSGRSERTDTCESLYRYPDRATLFTSFKDDPDYGPYLNTGVHAYPTTKGAADYLAKLRNGLSTCATYVNRNGWIETMTEMSFTSFGDDSLAIRTTFTHPTEGWTQYSDDITVRYGSAITSLSHWDAFWVDTYQTEEWAALATERLINAVGS